MRQRDKRVVIRSTPANTRRSLKDGYSDHGQNCVDHIALMFGAGTRRKAAPNKEPRITSPPDPPGWMAV